MLPHTISKHSYWTDPQAYAVPSRAWRAKVALDIPAQGVLFLIRRCSFIYETLSEHPELVNGQWNIETPVAVMLFVRTPPTPRGRVGRLFAYDLLLAFYDHRGACGSCSPRHILDR